MSGCRRQQRPFRLLNLPALSSFFRVIVVVLIQLAIEQIRLLGLSLLCLDLSIEQCWLLGAVALLRTRFLGELEFFVALGCFQICY